MRCCICERGIEQNVDLFRINEKGVKGIWACNQHIHLFPKKQPDSETCELIAALRADTRQDTGGTE